MPPAAEAEDAADFGEEAPAAEAPAAAAPPQRAMPDYGDVVDGDEEQESKPFIDVKKEDKSAAPKRLDAIHIAGVARLNRTHIEEVLQSKNLPEFVRVDWISDTEVIVVFDSDQDAAAVLKSATEGFRDVENSGSPGPGMWRALRGMLDFRQATIADSPDLGFKRVHRGGKQVREFRLFSAMTDSDKQILEREQEQEEARKRPAPPRDDLDDFGQPKKKAKTKRDDGMDLLERMAHVDRRILVKQEERGELPDLPDVAEPDGAEDEWDEDNQDGWDKLKEKWAQAQTGGWGRDDDEPRRGKGKGKGKRKGKGNGKQRKGKQRDTSGPYDGPFGVEGYDHIKDSEPKKARGKGNALSGAGALGTGIDANKEELERRATRAARFQKPSAA